MASLPRAICPTCCREVPVVAGGSGRLRRLRKHPTGPGFREVCAGSRQLIASTGALVVVR